MEFFLLKFRCIRYSWKAGCNPLCDIENAFFSDNPSFHNPIIQKDGSESFMVFKKKNPSIDKHSFDLFRAKIKMVQNDF